jgi:hypothetical protein
MPASNVFPKGELSERKNVAHIPLTKEMKFDDGKIDEIARLLYCLSSVVRAFGDAVTSLPRGIRRIVVGDHVAVDVRPDALRDGAARSSGYVWKRFDELSDIVRARWVNFMLVRKFIDGEASVEYVGR